MKTTEKFGLYIKSKGLTIRDAAVMMDNYNENVLARQLRAPELSSTLLKKFVKAFPEADMNYLLKEESSKVEEKSEPYKNSNVEIIEEIETQFQELNKKFKELKENLSH